ncbi:hypothetical protein IQ270_28970 [Microcoleus sp. LEGE 07076]|uniref:hypothetical protein n=1 Tax=Microcoleus sp. LEGE 07076 TaxID=915322 RepID=UPI0018809DFA|nr:hypothetical protein [Microcoleus sp. LEGE 07076]MBE9188558.1 hypothetical protein [Microcoleus sp. LEGE 07076]
MVDSVQQRCDRLSLIARLSAVEFLWNCREAALPIISSLAIDRQLNFLMFRRLCTVKTIPVLA